MNGSFPCVAANEFFIAYSPEAREKVISKELIQHRIRFLVRFMVDNFTITQVFGSQLRHTILISSSSEIYFLGVFG